MNGQLEDVSSERLHRLFVMLYRDNDNDDSNNVADCTATVNRFVRF